MRLINCISSNTIETMRYTYGDWQGSDTEGDTDADVYGVEYDQ